jgi:hypothetical protein
MSTNIHQSAPLIEFHKMVNGRRQARVAVSEEAAACVEQLLREKGFKRQHHANCKPVIICGEPNLQVYERRIAEHGARPISEWWFASAVMASRHFGYRENEVAKALSRAAQRGDSNATVGGVPIAYADTAVGIG